MLINVKLNQANGRAVERDPFIVADNDTLQVAFQSSTKFDKLAITARNGDSSAVLVYTKEPITIPDKLLTAGFIEMRVAVIRGGQHIKELDIEPIAIKEIAHGFAGHLEFDRILTQQARMIEMLDKIALTISENQTRTNAVVLELAAKIENLKVL